MKGKGGEQATIIGVGTTIKGEIATPNELQIYGTFEGSSITCTNEVVIGRTGEVTADIEAKSLDVSGKIFGNINCSKRVELMEHAQIVGNISSKELIINKGAIFHGRSDMLDGKKVPKNVRDEVVSFEPEEEIENIK